ncbi:MAG: ATP-binding domain-containing protein [Myxococcales bacterium]|nr:ATP-binding domain-containing protein [Myxococcales bacterium]
MSDPQAVSQDPELERIVDEEEECLGRVHSHLENRAARKSERPPAADYESQMLALRDEIAGARQEDLPPLLEQMDRLQSLAAHRREQSEGFVDARSPYFGRLVLQEGPRRREVLIGRSTYLDTKSGVRIVDWRDAPVSRLYYRYDEGDEYDEVFGDREVSGEVVTRRSLNIVEGELRRIGSPQGAFARGTQGSWRRLSEGALKLTGGQGTALRADQHHAPGTLGVGVDGGDDRHLKEITALIDPRQFDLITKPDSGLVVIQGGAGSGKTTIGLHRLAYLAYNDPRRFRPDRMLVVVFNQALARYIGQVLPALGVSGLAIRTYEDWAERTRALQLPRVPRRYTDGTPSVVTRLKKHPTMLRLIDEEVVRLGEGIEEKLSAASLGAEGVSAEWRMTQKRPLAHRLHSLRTYLERGGARALDTDQRVRVERVIAEGLAITRDVVSVWADLLSDHDRLKDGLERYSPGAFSADELKRAHAWCAARSGEMLLEIEEAADAMTEKREKNAEPRELDGQQGVDGAEVEERSALDREDDTLLLRLCQRLRGPLRRGARGKDALVYEHILVDEAQDLSPVELAVVMGTVSRAQSVTLAGDVAQRLHMDNGFSDWKTVLSELDLSHVEIEPLELSYRSTAPILEFSREVLGPLATGNPPQATRGGAPVELFSFAHAGDAVGFLSEALRDLMTSEPQASVAVIARYPEQADIYFKGLEKGEVSRLRRIADQDFPFKPGVDVTDVRQVKGLEFDYVVLVEVSQQSYPDDEEARHLMHIAATRAAHQLWLLATGTASPLIPDRLQQQSY